MKRQLLPVHPFLYFILFLTIGLVSHISVSADDLFQFPDIDKRFSSSTQSQPITAKTIDYGGRVQIHLYDGEIHRRRNGENNYDFYFRGNAELVILDTLSLDNLWRREFKEQTSITLTTAYICGFTVNRILELDPDLWKEDKLPRREHQKLHFKTQAPHKYFGISLPGELSSWSESELTSPPIWFDLNYGKDKQLVLYVSPEIEEQLNLYTYDELTSQPFLGAAFTLNHLLVSKPIGIDSTTIDIFLQESGRFRATSTLRFTEGSDTRGLMLILPHLYKVDSVLDANNDHLSFIKKHLKNVLYISPRSLSPGKADNITIFYRGKFISARYAGYDFPANLTGWFPHMEHRNLGHFTINYTFYSDLTLNSVGTKIDEVDSGDFRRSTYSSDAEISYISFAVGKYDVFHDTVGKVPLTLFIESQNTIGVFNQGTPRKILSYLSGSFETFVDWFGPPIVNRLNVVDRAHFAGQSSPGLIHLPLISLFDIDGELHLCAHEIAHQWFGHTTVPKTYREMWLSEGLAEYTSYLYMHDIEKNFKECDKLVKTWRRDVIEEGNIGDLYSRGYRAGPISLGGRLYQSYSPGDYIALIYAKASYMLRMLHFEIDGPDYRTDFFKQTLGEFVRTHHGGPVSSSDFGKVISKRLGKQRAIEFLSQWLYDWRIPDYECSYEIKTDEKNREYVELSIIASEVRQDFSTPFPIQIEFEDKSTARYRVDKIGQNNSHRLGPFPQKIKKVLFDPDNILLYRNRKVVEL